jgi:hypothetical protein
MSTTTAAATMSDRDRTDAEGKTTRSKSPKGSRSYSVSLAGAAGAQLRLVAQRKPDGSAIAYAVLKKAGSKTGERGITTTHRDLPAARAHVDKQAAEAVGPKLGWVRMERKAGFERKPDKFDVIPSATATPSATPTTTTAAKTTRKK